MTYRETRERTVAALRKQAYDRLRELERRMHNPPRRCVPPTTNLGDQFARALREYERLGGRRRPPYTVS